MSIPLIDLTDMICSEIHCRHAFNYFFSFIFISPRHCPGIPMWKQIPIGPLPWRPRGGCQSACDRRPSRYGDRLPVQALQRTEVLGTPALQQVPTHHAGTPGAGTS